MYKKDELVGLEKNFAVRHFPAVVLLIIYLVVETFQSFSVGAPAFIRAAIVCMVLALEQAFRTSDFFNSPRFIFIMKYIQLMIMAAFIMDDGYRNYEYIIYFLIYMCIALEQGIFFDLSDGGVVFLHSMLMNIPVLIWTIVYMITNRSLTYVITSAVMITSFIITMYSVLSYIGSRYEHFENAVLAKDRMLDKAMDINREMLEKQEKLYYVNEQLALKRIELESANSKINANILEMHFQNEMLHYFTEAFDIVKINDYFAGKLISDIGIRTAGLLKTAVNGERSIYEDYKKNNPMYDISARYKLFGDINEAAADVLYDMFTCDEFMKRLEDGHIFICENVKHTEYEGLKSYHILSFAAKLMLVDGRCAGVYILCHNEQDFFMHRETFFDNILAELQVGLNNAFLYSQFENFAKRDGLTGLYNRRVLNKFMEKYRHPDAELLKQTVYAAMFDIDNFKSINDKYGHLFGDAAIIAVAQTIQRIADEHGGSSYRYGGEEFVVLFIDKTLEEVVSVVESIHKAIREREISFGGYSIYINTSAGVSAYPELCHDPALVIDNADKAMYISKTTGKGKITIDGTSPNI